MFFLFFFNVTVTDLGASGSSITPGDASLSVQEEKNLMEGGRCNGKDVVDVRCRLQINAVITTNDPLLLQMLRITW